MAWYRYGGRFLDAGIIGDRAMAEVKPSQRLETNSPKCANCHYWHRSARAWGECVQPDSKVFVNEATARHVEKIRLTTDLGICSDWMRAE